MFQTIPFVVLLLVVLRLTYEYQRDRDLPPGPRRLPLLGNLLIAPKGHPHRVYQEWSKKYGKIFSLQYGSDTVIVITDHDIARALLDKKASVYADRPRMVMAGENLTKGMHMLLRHFDEQYVLHQRMEAPVLSPRASSTYLPLQDLESKQMVYEFLSRNDFKDIFERYAASLAYTLIYGFRASTGHEKCLADARRVQSNFAKCGKLGAWIVDAVPALNYLPAMFAPWKKLAAQFYQIEAKMHMDNMRTGLSSRAWNWAKDFHNSREAQSMSEIELAYDLGILADAGLDTTAMTLQIFILACRSSPGFMEKAQQQIDAVVGPNRLPDFSDKDSLPYIQAIVKETLRWRPFLPLGFPHRTTKDDHYLNYRIPKGSIVLAVSWAINLDGTRYDKPEEFRPERWLEESEDFRAASFGYGRRICTGRHIADNSLYLIIARLLWAFDIRAPQDQFGNEVKVDDMAFTTGFTERPCDFEAIFEPRSEERKEIVERLWSEADKDVDGILNGIKEAQVGLGMKPRA